MPGAFVAYGLTDLADHLPEFNDLYPGAVVSKKDRAHLGLGVGRWPSLEALYSQAGLHAPALSPGGAALRRRGPGFSGSQGGRLCRGL